MEEDTIREGGVPDRESETGSNLRRDSGFGASNATPGLTLAAGRRPLGVGHEQRRGEQRE